MNAQMKQRMNTVYRAYVQDGFRPVKAYVLNDAIGVMAVHNTSKDYDTGSGKTSYYLDGTPYERGYLLGLLAEPQISQMAVKFTDSIIFDFIDAEFLNILPLLNKLMVSLLYEMCDAGYDALPAHIHEEVDGILAGCKKSNPRTQVTHQRLAVMNMGFDALCALAYTGGFLRERAPDLSHEAIRLTMMCNAFSVYGALAGGGHYFARDFMFVTGGVFQRYIAHFIHVPSQGEGEIVYPYVSITAPGIVGSISAMNTKGVAVGVNMSPAANCDPKQLGMNSLLLARECILRGGSAREAADVIFSTNRGVTWNYALSDGANDEACTMEAGASWPVLDPLQYPPAHWRPYLPDEAFLQGHPAAPLVNGAIARWCEVAFPEEYYAFNPELWKHYQQTVNPNIKLLEGAFLPDGFINRTPKEKNCPLGYYFAPQRTQGNVHITTNHFLMPQMRLCAMDAWTQLVARGHINDIQWRYDELNHQIRQALAERGFIDYDTAKRLAEFLAPYGEYPDYYAKNPKSADKKELRIEGCASVFDLKKVTVESHYGYYCDGWVKTSLINYVQ